MADRDYGTTELATRFTVADCLAAREAGDAGRIAEAILLRFSERYLHPIEKSQAKHGFAMMAVACLRIEALESFRRGWKDSNRRSQEAFRSFFHRHEEFLVFRENADPFYVNVRCGILQQVETTGGWRIRREGPLFEPRTITVNATRFSRALEQVLRGYCSDLEEAPWESQLWRDARKKLDALCDNCRP